MRQITWDEISHHNNSDDCWVVIDGDVYDVTEWIRCHPGGNVISALAGEDISALFHSSHLHEPPSTLLESLKIGRVPDYRPDFSVVNDAFLVALKKAVFQHFETCGIEYRLTRRNIHSILISSVLLIACWSCMYLLAPWGVLAAIPMGFVTCSLIGSFGHEQIHGNLLTRTDHLSGFAIDILWGIYIPFMPRNYFQYEHLKHHCHPMHPNHDYDVYALKHFVRLTPYTDWKRHHAHQHLYAPLIYGFYIAFQLICGYITPFFDARELLKERYAFAHIGISSAVAFAFHFALPIAITGIGWTLLCAGLYFISWQTAIYVSSGLPHMTTQIQPHGITDSWSRYVCATTANLKCGDRFFDWLTGGLNYHLVHHLLPTIPREHLAETLPIVERICREFGYRNKHYTSFSRYYRDHHQFLIRLGRAPETARS